MSTGKFIICNVCDTDYCYCSDPDIEPYTDWEFEPLYPVIYPLNCYRNWEIRYCEDGIDTFYDAFEYFEIDTVAAAIVKLEEYVQYQTRAEYYANLWATRN